MDTTDRSVSGIIAAFRTSLDEFKSYRERRRKVKKSTGQKNKALGKKEEEVVRSGDESKLSHSLRQGAVDVQREYEKNFRVLGDQYAVGDPAAHSSLGRTLRKLNTCLHNIISSLLCCGQKDIRIDYKHLTSVSDISRHEALEALSLLSYRMSQSALSLHQLKKAEKQKQDKDSKIKARKLHAKSESNLTERISKAKDKSQLHVRKVQLKTASTPKLAMVRPKARRSSSSKSELSVATTSIPPTPPPVYSPTPIPTGLPSPRNRYPNHPTSPPAASPPRRRQDKLTPSVYTFASGSTRLGEIPETRWAMPYDHEAMAQLNRAAEGRPWPVYEDGVVKPKRGFWGMFKKTGAGKAVEVGA